MARPKASQRIKCVALAFVHVVTKVDPASCSDDAVSVNAQFGRKSVHSGMLQCLPHLTRCGTVFENREVETDPLYANTSSFVKHECSYITISSYPHFHFYVDNFCQGISEMEMNKLLRREVSSHPSMYDIGHFAPESQAAMRLQLRHCVYRSGPSHSAQARLPLSRRELPSRVDRPALARPQ